jgi:hypothetical protein
VKEKPDDRRIAMNARILLIDPSGWQKKALISIMLCCRVTFMQAMMLIIDRNARQMSDEELTKAVAKFNFLSLDCR